MTKARTMNLLTDVIAATFILLFTYTGINKLTTLTEFQVVLSKSPFLYDLSPVLSWMLPVVELIVALLLFIPATKRIGLLGATILMGLFTVYIAYMLLFSSDLPCSCGGVLKQLNWQEHLVFNGFFLLMGLLALRLSKNHQLFIAINRNRRTPVE